ncbi:MAG: TolB family protein [Gemmatimonadaceae bacterium]
MSKPGLLLAAFLVIAPMGSLGAQFLTRPEQDWRTVETQRFLIHYPKGAQEWTLPLAARIESVHSAVSSLVGSAPESRITVIVDDPYNVANGSASPFLDRPTIFLWTTPPVPQSSVAHHRGWSEILAVHELAHIAHMTRPSRNPTQRALFRLLPVSVSPIVLKLPRWVIEGYATYVEGRLTGSGRPHSVYRATRLRQWALEGRLPRYNQLNQTSGFEGGAMAYLAGSAFLEWLAERRGDESLVHLWRRLTARKNRSFAQAFAGVYGGSPEDLYGRFTAEITGRALAIENTLASRDTNSGEVIQKLDWGTGDPAVSRDGTLLSLVLRSQHDPSRLVVWKTADEPEDSNAAEARKRALERDPQDVPDMVWRPRPKRAVATLHPVAGQSHENPRFLADGKRILVNRHVPLPSGGLRSDLFIWEFTGGAMRRITRGAGVQRADPEPDGRSAVAERCTFGSCDLVRVDLASGAISVLREGKPEVTHYRPRVSPDGSTIALSVHERGRWRVATVGKNGSGFRYVDPEDGADRFDAVFLPGGQALVVVSEREGIANLEIVSLTNGDVRSFTRVTSATHAPEPNPADGRVYFLKLHAKGRDLNRIDPSRTTEHANDIVPPAAGLAPAATIPNDVGETFAVGPVASARPYGIGPSRYFIAPGSSIATEGRGMHLVLTRSDPVGRLTILAQGAYGERGTWSGGSVAAIWKRFRPALTAELFATRHHPSQQRAGTFASPALDADYRGGTAVASVDWNLVSSSHSLRLGASLGQLRGGTFGDSIERRIAFSDYGGGMLLTPSFAAIRFGLGVRIAGGQTRASDKWTRGIGSAAMSIGRRGRTLGASGSFGVVGAGAPAFERFVLGGVEPPLFDNALLAQRFEMPALPLGIATGRRAAHYRLSLSGFLPLTAYYWAGSAGDEIGTWHRVAGVESAIALDAIPLFGTPAITVRLGAGHSLDEPYRKKTRAYATAVYRP